MRKFQRFFPAPVVLALFVLALPRPGAAFSVGFKFTGGYGSMNGGDMNESIRGQFDYYKAIASFYGFSIDGDYKALRGGLDAGGDLILYITPAVGLGIGAGLIKAHGASKLMYSGAFFSGALTFDSEVKVIPLRAGLHVAVPLGSLANLTLNGGAEYYLAKFSKRTKDDYNTGWEQYDIEAESKGKIGAFAGLGLEIKVHPNLSLLLEGRGRYARFDGFSGSIKTTNSSGYSSSASGELWYYEIDLGSIGKFPSINVSDTPPSSLPLFQNVRSARLNLDGFAALAGVMIRL